MYHSHSQSQEEITQPEDGIWDRWLCHICFANIVDGMPPEKRRCNTHEVGICAECEKKYMDSIWCVKCAQKKARGNYRIPSVGVGRYRRSAREDYIPVIHFGAGSGFPSLALEMSSEGLSLVTPNDSCPICD